MPESADVRSLEELGCGHYGCVLPTEGAAWVFKLTSDPSEAHFIALALQLAAEDGEWPRGLTRYASVWALPGVTHRGRQVFALWRERAEVVGLNVVEDRIARAFPDPAARVYTRRSVRDFGDLLSRFLLAGRALRKRWAKLHPRWREANVEAFRAGREDVYAAGVALMTSTLDRAAHLLKYPGRDKFFVAGVLQYMENIGQTMENTYLADAIGSLFTDYLERGVVLADVHHGNVGLDAEGTIIVTDPGHAILLDPALESVQVPVL